VSLDMDGQTRLNPPCIGADEFFGNDAGISAIAPQSTYCTGGSKTVNVTLVNYGGSPLTSANIEFYINGTIQITYPWTGSLASNASTSVNIGSATFPSGALTLLAKTTSANGSSPDGNTLNDS